MQKKTVKLLSCLLAFLFVFAFGSQAKAISFNLDEYSRNNLIVEELTSGNIISENKADEKAYPASITKLMTSLVALDHFAVSDTITVGDEVTQIPSDSSRAWVNPSDTFTFYDLLHAMLLPSGNDAAMGVAVATARKVKNDPDLSVDDAVDVFVTMMNEKAAALGMEHTHFNNVHGYDDKNNYSTARDLLILGKAAISNATISEVCKKSVYTCKTQSHTYKWYSTNRFLYKSFDSELEAQGFNASLGDNAYYNPNVVGLKTGNTDLQGRCFMFYYVDGDVKILGVLLNNGDEALWKKTDKMIRFFSQNYVHQSILSAGSKELKIRVPNVDYRNKTTLTLSLDSDVLAYVHQDDVQNLSFVLEPNQEYFELRDDTRLDYYLKQDAPAGTVIATLKVMCLDTVVYERVLTYEKDLKVATFKDYLIRYSPLIVISVIVLVVLILAVRMQIEQKRRRLRRRRKRSAHSTYPQRKETMEKQYAKQRTKHKKPRI